MRQTILFFFVMVLSITPAFGGESRKVYSEGEVPSVSDLLSIFGEEAEPARPEVKKSRPVKLRSFRDASMVEGNTESSVTLAKEEKIVETKPIVEKQPEPVKKPATVAIPIRFKLNSAIVEASETRTLKNLATAMCQLVDKAKFLIEGHTDSSGSEDHNLALSVRRAKAVRNKLVKLGVKQEQLIISGVGSGVPLNAKEPTSFENRRVEFKKLLVRNDVVD